MLKRLPLLIALGLGSLGLAWGLFVLQGIFLTERDDAPRSAKAKFAA